MRQMLWSLGNMHGTVSKTCKKKKTVLTIRSQKEIVSWRIGRRRKRRKGRGRKEEKKKYK